VYLISTGGREKLLQVFDKLRDEETLENCAFICDSDLWIFNGIPSEYDTSEIIKTDGYSIENDLIKDYPPNNLMLEDEERNYDDELLLFSQWFSFEVAKALRGAENSLSTYVGLVLDDRQLYCKEDFEKNIDAKFIHELIQSDLMKHLRGKSVMQIVMRQLAKKGRASKHNHLNFLEHAANSNGVLFSRISQAVQIRALNKQNTE
jgi:hypothetical protein